jgi:hypothetical protein
MSDERSMQSSDSLNTPIARSNISERGSRRPPTRGRMRCGSKKAGQMVRPSDIGIALRRSWIERMLRSKAKSQPAAQQEQRPLHRAARDRFYICGEPGPFVLVII